MTIAFDFSIEEIWPTLIAGATLVAGPTDAPARPGLADFLRSSEITVLYCVPTLLATLDRDVPSVRTLIVGGEACPRDLVERWSRPGRRMLNTYGPTETTVTATWSELHPDRARHHRPSPARLPGLHSRRRAPARAPGQAGELCIGGKGVAHGYINRPDLTAERFVSDPFAADPVGAPLPHRRPGPLERRRRNRISRAASTTRSRFAATALNSPKLKRFCWKTTRWKTPSLPPPPLPEAPTWWPM